MTVKDEVENSLEEQGDLERRPECVIILGNNTPKCMTKENLVGTQATREYLALVWAKYQALKAEKNEAVEGAKKAKSELIDELCRNVYSSRKVAIQAMNSQTPPRQRMGGRRAKCGYAKETQFELVKLWKEMGRMGAKKMRAAIPEWISFYHTETCTIQIRQELLSMSARTIERILRPIKAKERRRRNTGTTWFKKVKTLIPVRPLGLKIEEVGHVEGDSVAHCGESMSGQFAWTLTLTDILSGWTENEAVWNKEAHLTRNALVNMESRFLELPLSNRTQS